jgi:predicted enzyme related to lactoylglutathione lyase
MAIIAPMLAQLGVTDVTRSITFYRDVLGFNENWTHREKGSLAVAEFQLGPAKLQIALHDGARDNPEQWHARRATLLFFQTDDLTDLHNAVKRRGGQPTDVKTVDYWMRMKMFDIIDPDGHAIWFGEQIAR